MTGVDDVDAMFAAAPDGFIAARDAAVAGAKKRGDDAQAKALAALRKPTVAAWAVNLLALKRPDLVKGLVELAASMRSAQRELRGADLRKLTTERRALVNALVAEAKQLATSAGAAKFPQAEVETTLNAAIADEQVAAVVRSGRLLKTTTYEGFGELPEASATPTRAPDSQHRKRLAEARTAEKEAHAELERAEGAERKATEKVEEIEAAIDDLKRELISAKAELSQRRDTHRFAQRRLAAATREVSEVEAER